MRFSSDFIWGAASSAYQTEGAPCEDGKSPSIWDTFSHTPGTIFEGNTGDLACDGYHRFAEDIEQMAVMGVKAYRLSVSWPRVDPQGDGSINKKGLAYYDSVIDCCLNHSIEPYVTCYHWDLPQALENKGGWRNRDSCEAFARYCGILADHFRGRVKNYFTLNEVQCVVQLGFQSGIHAPGQKLQTEAQFSIWHHLLLAHGLAFGTIKEKDPCARLSLASTGRLCYPESDSAADLDAARRQTFAVSENDWLFTHQMVFDPLVLGRYPETDDPVLKALFENVPERELDLINTDVDCLALNIYNGSPVRAGKNGAPEYVPKSPGCPRTAMKWPITPEVMAYGPRFLWERYKRPILITENGVSCNDFAYLDGKVHDADRIDFLTRYLRSLRCCAESGVPIKGYFHWSFTDNFEWNCGYGERMGLVYVDYSTQQRIPKDSAVWYSRIIAENGENL